MSDNRPVNPKVRYYNNKPRNKSASIFRRLVVHKGMQKLSLRSTTEAAKVATSGFAFLRSLQTRVVSSKKIGPNGLSLAEVAAGFTKKRKVKPMTKAQLLRSLNKVASPAGFNPFVPHSQQKPARSGSYRAGSEARSQQRPQHSETYRKGAGAQPHRRQFDGTEVKAQRGGKAQKRGYGSNKASTSNR